LRWPKNFTSVEPPDAGGHRAADRRTTHARPGASCAAGSPRRRDPTVRVGFYGSVSSALLTEVLRRYAGARPGVEVTVRELELSHIGELLDGNVDVAFTRMRPDEADAKIEVLLEEPRVVALPAGHRLADTAREVARTPTEARTADRAAAAGESGDPQPTQSRLTGH
jgi:DNA-binding transcriptional LysR family regulator